MIGRQFGKRITSSAVNKDPAESSTDESSEPTVSRADWSNGSLFDRVLRPRTIASFILAAVIVAVALSRFDLDFGAVLTEMSQANPGFLALAAVTYYGAFFLRAARWRSLLHSAEVKPAQGKSLPGLGTLVLIFIISWFANCLVPAKLGDAYRGYLLKRRSGTSFGAALGTIFAERLADLVTLAGVLIISGVLVFGRHVPSSISTWLYLAAGIGVLLIVGLVGVLRFRHQLRRLVPLGMRDHYIRLEEGALGSFGRLPTLLSLTAVIWLIEGVRLFLVSQSVSAGLSVSEALFIALLASLLTAIPVTPAGLGFVEFGVVSALVLLGINEQTAASVALLDRVVAYWSVILVGGIVYLVTRWAWRRS